ncbi:MAG TPA: 8-oxo-dGTP diphosphatase [bacterium]|nr:8-oxo-dGTP diphosphatase [bacterium]HPP87517.1 8-oxo-dGTP diphosphatase [bacterium]
MKLGALVYIIKNKKVLMLHRNKNTNDSHYGRWVAPGGKINFNETPADCAMREVLEETGLTLKNLKLSGFLTFPNIGNSPFGDLWYVWVFKSTKFSGELIDSPEGELQWINIADLEKINMWDGDRIFTPLVFKNKIFDIELIYDNNKFLNFKIRYI